MAASRPSYQVTSRPIPRVVESDVSADSWNDSMVTWLVNPVSIPKLATEGRLVTASNIEAVRETTVMFAKLDYRFRGGHARSAVVQDIAMEVEPLLKHVSATYAPVPSRRS